jgi:ATP-dependent Clp protease protease subunit
MAAGRKTAYYLNDRLQEIHNYDVNVESREIFLVGRDGDSEIDTETSYKVIKNIRFLSSISSDDIVIHLNNPGGCVYSGYAIYDALKSCRCYIRAVCHGSCQSMGTIIVQAADERLSMPNCLFMLHEGTTGSNDTIRNAKSSIERDILEMKIMMNIYAEKFIAAEHFKGYTLARVKKFIEQKFDKKGDWYLGSEEAKNYGLIDNIVGLTKYKNLGEVVKDV